MYDLLQSAGCSSSTCAPQRLSALAAAFRDLPSAQASFWAAVLPCLPKGRYAAPSAYALALGFIVDLPQARRQSHGCVSALWRPVRSISKRLSCFGAVRVLRLCFVQRTSIYLFCAAAGAARACRCVVEAGVSRAPAALALAYRLITQRAKKAPDFSGAGEPWSYWRIFARSHLLENALARFDEDMECYTREVGVHECYVRALPQARTTPRSCWEVPRDPQLRARRILQIALRLSVRRSTASRVKARL